MGERRPRLYLDEDALGLRDGLTPRGYDVHDARSEKLLGVRYDGLHLLRATWLQTILITNNRHDFEALASAWARQRREHHGVISFHAPRGWRRSDIQIALIDGLLRATPALALMNRMYIWEAKDQRWRIYDGTAATEHTP